MMKVKICGITNLEDARVAVEAGADYLGFIFYPPSKRSVDVPTCQRIVIQLRNGKGCPLMVGVFVNETASHMVHVLDKCDLELAQLSGEEVPFLVADERSPLYGRSYKGLRPTSQSEAEADLEWYITPQKVMGQPSLLIDTYHPTLRGGSGKVGNWAMSAQLAQAVPGMMLAGGLSADNVAEAIKQVRPFAVDVASGVEMYPGKKDHDLVRKFIRRAKAA